MIDTNSLNGIIEFVLLVGLFVYTLYLLKTNRLSPQHAVTWIIAEVMIFIFVVFDPITQMIMQNLGIENKTSVIYFLVFIWLILLFLDLLVRISKLSNQLRLVNQEFGLMQERYERLEKRLGLSNIEIEPNKR